MARDFRRIGRVVGRSFTVAGGLFLAGLMAFVALIAYHAVFPPASHKPTTPSFPRTAAREFLDDWATGDWAGAGLVTDNPAAAGDALVSFNDGLDIDDRLLSVGAAQASGPGVTTVAFHATMHLFGGGPWDYDGRLLMTQTAAGPWLVKWDPSDLYPQLTADTALKRIGSPLPAHEVLGGDGQPLDLSQYPSLSAATDYLVPPGTASDGYARVDLVDQATGATVATVLDFGAPPSADAPHSTLEARAQAAAEQAILKPGRTASVVVLHASTGQIAAFANFPASGFDTAFSGTVAPGSTFKVLTASALLSEGGVSPGTTLGCPGATEAGDRAFHNDNGESAPGATLTQALALSCNTTFVDARTRLPGGGADLAAFARDVYGLGGDWKTGMPSFDGNVPAPADDATFAADMFGQGDVQMNPLTVASVTATAITGHFHQPVLTTGRSDVLTTSRELPPTTVQDMRALMRAVVTDGTAKSALGDLPGVGAKTGTAQVGNGPADGWITAYRGDYVVAVWVQGGGDGAASAGPVAHDILAALG